MTTKYITTLIPDITRMLTSSEGSAMADAAREAWAVQAGVAYGAALIRASSGQRAKPPTARWGSLWASEIGKPCKRQLYYRVAGIIPDPRPVEAAIEDGTAGRFLLGDAIEAGTVYLIKAAGHEVTDEGQRVALQYGDWEISGKRDLTIDGWSVDIKSASQFAFKAYSKNGLTRENDTFGYRFQPNFYRTQGGDAGKAGSAILFTEKGSMALGIVDVTYPGAHDVQSEAESTVDILDTAWKTGKLPERVQTRLVQRASTGQQVLAVAKSCEFCDYKDRCLAGAEFATTTPAGTKSSVTYFKKEPTGGYED